jgi:hypothetical protein
MPHAHARTQSETFRDGNKQRTGAYTETAEATSMMHERDEHWDDVGVYVRRAHL